MTIKKFFNQFKLGFKSIFILLISFIALKANAQILQASSVRDIKTYISKFKGEDTLVLFDLDYVLFAPKDRVLRYAGEENNYRAKKFQAIIANFKNKEIEVDNEKISMADYLISQILASAKVELVSHDILPFINSLEAQKFTVIGFTANSGGKYGIIQNEATLHLSRLKSLGYHSFESNINLFKRNFPKCISRIIFTNKADKGGVILDFFKHLNQNYKNIIFVDDRLKNFISVQNILKNHRINYFGIHYTELKDRNEVLNKDIADKQFQVLSKEHIWLSDDEAQDRLSHDQK